MPYESYKYLNHKVPKNFTVVTDLSSIQAQIKVITKAFPGLKPEVQH